MYFTHFSSHQEVRGTPRCVCKMGYYKSAAGDSTSRGCVPILRRRGDFSVFSSSTPLKANLNCTQFTDVLSQRYPELFGDKERQAKGEAQPDALARPFQFPIYTNNRFHKRQSYEVAPAQMPTPPGSLFSIDDASKHQKGTVSSQVHKGSDSKDAVIGVGECESSHRNRGCRAGEICVSLPAPTDEPISNDSNSSKLLGKCIGMSSL